MHAEDPGPVVAQADLERLSAASQVVPGRLDRLAAQCGHGASRHGDGMGEANLLPDPGNGGRVRCLLQDDDIGREARQDGGDRCLAAGPTEPDVVGGDAQGHSGTMPSGRNGVPWATERTSRKSSAIAWMLTGRPASA